MPKSALPRPAPDFLTVALAAILILTAYRVALLAFATADLFVDEAQYWLWGQELDWGYYSKPPLIGWVIRAVTDLAGSDSPFWVRVAGPLFHGASALILTGVARQIADRSTAGAVGLAYATMPSVAVGSFLISTDTILMPFFAGSVGLYIGLIRAPGIGRAIPLGLCLGLCLGLGMMAKYAAIYFVLGAGLGALFVAQARIGWQAALAAVAAFAVVISPNVIWNLQNDLQTLSHTADNVDWVHQPGIRLNWSGATEFLGAQFAVFGPVLFGAYLVVAVRAFRSGAWLDRWLVWMSAPILALVTVQALLSKAYANWAVMACVGILLLAVPVLWARLRWLYWVGLVPGLAVSLAVPIAATHATEWRANEGGRLLLRRYVGRAALSREAIARARAQGLHDIVADDREVLADLFYTAHDSGLRVFAVPHPDHVPHYFAQKHSYPPDRNAAALYVSTTGAPPCAAVPLQPYEAGDGAYRTRGIQFWQTAPGCWSTAQ